MYKPLISSALSVVFLLTSTVAPMVQAGDYYRSGVSVGFGTSYNNHHRSHYRHGYRHYRPRHHYGHSYHSRHYYSPYRSGYNDHVSIGFRTHLDSNPAAVILGGLSLFYLGGIFYKSLHNNDVYTSRREAPYRQPSYEVVAAPAGAYVKTLPQSHSRVHAQGKTYYTYADTYYRWDSEHQAYQVVQAPSLHRSSTSSTPVVYQQKQTPTISQEQGHFSLGSTFIALPQGARPVRVKGRQHFELDGYYFLPVQRSGRLVYEVVSL